MVFFLDNGFDQVRLDSWIMIEKGNFRVHFQGGFEFSLFIAFLIGLFKDSNLAFLDFAKRDRLDGFECIAPRRMHFSGESWAMQQPEIMAAGARHAKQDFGCISFGLQIGRH